MEIDIVGFDTSKRIESIKAYRDVVVQTLPLTKAKDILDKVAQGYAIRVDLTEEQIKILLETGFELINPTKREIKGLMNQLIQKFLSLGDKARAKRLIAMWIELNKEEDNV